MSLQQTEQSRWFAVEVLPHEPALRAYLRARFPSLHDLDDIIQETYSRLFREKQAGNIRHTRSFMFTAARNLAFDVFRRKRDIAQDAVTHFVENGVIEESPDAAEIVSQQQELDLLAEAVRTLPDRCRQVIMLRYLKGCSYKEIAALLGISTETVKTHMAKGMRRCAEYFQARGVITTPPRADDRS